MATYFIEPCHGWFYLSKEMCCSISVPLLDRARDGDVMLAMADGIARWQTVIEFEEDDDEDEDYDGVVASEVLVELL